MKMWIKFGDSYVEGTGRTFFWLKVVPVILFICLATCHAFLSK